MLVKEELNILLLGDGFVGKTEAMSNFLSLGTSHQPTGLSEIRECEICIDGVSVKLSIWDAAGHCMEDWSGLPLVIRNAHAHGVLLFYDVTNKDSFENIRHWMKTFAENTRHSTVR